MTPTHACLAAVALLGVLQPAPLGGQVCAGFPQLGVRRYRIAASAASFSYATSLGMSFTAGDVLHGTVSVGRTRDGELDASTYDLGLEAAADIANRERVVFLCPLVALSVSFGPYDYRLRPDDFHSVSGALGIGLAVVQSLSPQLALVPSIGVRIVRLSVTETFSGAEVVTVTNGDTYGLLWLGLGIAVNSTVTIRPTATVPFGLVAVGSANYEAVPFGREEGEVSLGISVGFSFGRRSRASP